MAIIKQDSYLKMGQIIRKIEQKFQISNIKSVKMQLNEAEYFCQN